MASSFNDQVAQMKTALAAAGQAADLPPHVQQQIAALAAEVQKLESLNQEQEVLKGKLKETTAKVTAQGQTTRDLYRRLVLALRAHYGPRSEKLAPFGIAVKT
jgi:hypothetical protein